MGLHELLCKGTSLDVAEVFLDKGLHPARSKEKHRAPLTHDFDMLDDFLSGPQATDARQGRQPAQSDDGCNLEAMLNDFFDTEKDAYESLLQAISREMHEVDASWVKAGGLHRGIAQRVSRLFPHVAT